jgi:hypothetical protein
MAGLEKNAIVDGLEYIEESYDNSTFKGKRVFWVIVVGYSNGVKEHGVGVLKWDDGDVYSGEFKEGRRTGFGVYTWPIK